MWSTASSEARGAIAAGDLRAAPGTRAPWDLVFSPDGRTAYVTETDHGTVAVLDAERRIVLRRYVTGGEGPRGVCLADDGKLLVVANSTSGSVVVLDAETGKLRHQLPATGAPWGVCAQAGGKRAWITLSQLDQVRELDLEQGVFTRSVTVGRRPGAVAVTPDGKNLVVANSLGSSASRVSVPEFTETRIPLRGTNVRGVALLGEGEEAYFTLMPAFTHLSTSNPNEIWHNEVQSVPLTGDPAATGERQWLDFTRRPGTSALIGCPDPEDLVIDPTGKYLFAAVGGRDILLRITVKDRLRTTIWPISQVETPVGSNPRGVAWRPGASEVWVANHLGNSVSVVDAASMQSRATIDLGASRPDPNLVGRRLFASGRLSASERFSCNSCHPEGGSDGLTWNFVHVPDGFDRRNSRDLRSAAGTAPFRWSGHDPDIATFVREEISGLLRGSDPGPEAIQALAAYVTQLSVPASPFRTETGSHTPDGELGRILFEGKAGCSTCHRGAKRGGTGLKAWVGTTPEGREVDVPHLQGVFDSAPYLHDGRATRLEDVFQHHNPARAHGQAHLLSEEEVGKLVRFLREL